MEIKSRFDHFNINVTNLSEALLFMKKALGLKNIVGRKLPTWFFHPGLPDGQRNRLPTGTDLAERSYLPMNWGENESHLCFV